MSELFEDKIEETPEAKDVESTEGKDILRPNIIGGSIEGTGYESAISGARIEIYPQNDQTIGTAIYDDAGAVVFRVLVGGTNVGDVVIGDYAGDEGIFYDKSAGTITFKGQGILSPTDLTDLTDGGATTLHKHDHGGQDGLDDNDHGAIYYTETEINNFAVKLTGAQEIADVKTFTSFPITPSSAPTTDYQTANKKYVDDNAPSGISVLHNDMVGNSETISGTTTVQIVSFIVPGGTMGANGAIRVKAQVRTDAENWTGAINLDLNASTIDGDDVNVTIARVGAASTIHEIDCIIKNMNDDAEQKIAGHNLFHNQTTAAEVQIWADTTAIDTSANMTVSLNGKRTSGTENGVLQVTHWIIELLPAP